MIKSLDQQPQISTKQDVVADKATSGSIAKLVIASTMILGFSTAFAQSTGMEPETSTGTQSSAQATMPPASGPSGSADPYVQKREADAIAKKEYKEQKKASKMQYKREKAEAKSALKAEKRDSTAERGAAIAADPSKPVTQGQTSYGGK